MLTFHGPTQGSVDRKDVIGVFGAAALYAARLPFAFVSACALPASCDQVPQVELLSIFSVSGVVELQWAREGLVVAEVCS